MYTKLLRQKLESIGITLNFLFNNFKSDMYPNGFGYGMNPMGMGMGTGMQYQGAMNMQMGGM